MRSTAPKRLLALVFFAPCDSLDRAVVIGLVAAAGKHCSIAGWREEAGYLLFHFPTWAKARAMQC